MSSSGSPDSRVGIRVAAQGERVPFRNTSRGARVSAGHDSESSLWFCNMVMLAGDWIAGVASTILISFCSSILHLFPATVQPVTATLFAVITCVIGLFRFTLWLVQKFRRFRPVGSLGYWNARRFVRVGIWVHLMVLCLGSSTLFYTTTTYVINVVLFGIASVLSPALLPPPLLVVLHLFAYTLSSFDIKLQLRAQLRASASPRPWSWRSS